MQESSSKTRIALCITGLDVGGAEQCCTQLALGLRDRGFEPLVVALQGRPATGRDRLVAALEAANLGVHFLGARRTADAPRALARLTNLLRSERPSLLQTFLHHANLLGRLAARRAGLTPVVCGLRVAERRSRARLWFDRVTSRWVDHYVAVSRDVAAFSQTEGGLAAERISVIPNGVDFARFDLAEPIDLATLGFAPARRAILYLGRLDPQKRVDWLLRLAPRIFERLPEHDLMLVGDGPQRSALQKLSQDLGIALRVHFVGTLGDVPRILRASDVLALPSGWEGMPNVVLEAMAAGRPVVATRVEGVRELLGDRVEEQSAPPDDSDGFVERIVALASNVESAQCLGAENARRAKEQFSLDAMLDAYASLYCRLLEANER